RRDARREDDRRGAPRPRATLDGRAGSPVRSPGALGARAAERRGGARAPPETRMPETPTPEPLTHRGADQGDDALAAEASAHLRKLPSLQLVAELLTRLREMQLPWWTPDHLRKAYGATDRMGWLAERPDLRQRITSEL